MSPLTSFIPGDLYVKQWSDIEPYFAELQKSNPHTLQGLKELIRHYSDTLSVFSENDTRASLAYSADMSNGMAKVHSMLFLDQLRPSLERTTNALEKKIVDHPQFKKLRDDRYSTLYHLFTHWVRNQCEQNIDLEKESEKTAQRCEEIIGGITVKIDDQEVPLALAERALETPDREMREEIWLKIQEARYAVKIQLDAHFDSLVKWRTHEGKRAGHQNYCQYEHYGNAPQHRAKDAALFHTAIEEHVVPLANEITQQHRKKLGLQRKILRPWDTDAARWGFLAPVEEGEPLFKNSQELLQKAGSVIEALHPPLLEHLQKMKEHHLLELEPRRHKEYTAYTESLEVQGLPYISMQAVGSYDSFATFIHEFGHSEHVFATRNEPLIFYRYFGTDYTMAETMSIGMGFLTDPFYERVFPTEQIQEMRRRDFEEFIRFLPWCAMMDKFQQWVYQNPKHTAEERDTHFGQLMERFYPEEINWRGLDKYRKNYWQNVTHIFSSPFYYIQYGFAALAALQLYQNFRWAPKETLRSYLQGMKMGASKPYPQVWKEMGITLDFSHRGFRHSLAQIPRLMGFVKEQLEELED